MIFLLLESPFIESLYYLPLPVNEPRVKHFAGGHTQDGYMWEVWMDLIVVYKCLGAYLTLLKADIMALYPSSPSPALKVKWSRH